jgi:acetyl esterase/lipase
MSALPPSDRDRLIVNRVTGPGGMSAVRAALASMTAGPPPLPADADLTPCLPQAGDVPGRWVNATGRPAVAAGVTLYAHGGGFEQRNPDFEQVMAYRLSTATGRAVRAVDYRLAPAYPFPAALDDVVTAYLSLLDRGVPASRVLLSGESAGATLVLSALHAMRSQNVPLPGGVVAVSPITDLTLSSPSIDSPAGEDVLSRPVLEHITAQYLDGAAPDQAPQSPLHGDLADLPPLLIVAGGDEALLDDARRFATAASAAGTSVTLDIYQGMAHAFHLSALPESPPQVATTFLDRLTAWSTVLPGAGIPGEEPATDTYP